MEIDCRVIPRASVTQVAGIRHGALLVRVAAPPVGDAANDELVAYLAALFKAPRRMVRITAGIRSRRKRVVVDGVSTEFVRRVLNM